VCPKRSRAVRIVVPICETFSHAEARRKRFDQKETERTKGGSELIVHQAFWPLPLHPPLILFVAIRAIRGGNVFLVFCHEFHEGHEWGSAPWHVSEGGLSNGQMIHQAFSASLFLCVRCGV
jgi:hypothetical protein